MAQTTSFTTPGMDYGVELGQIERKRALAQALQQQSMQPLEQQTAGGWVVRNSPLQAAAKLAQAFAAKKGQERSDVKQQQLNEKIQSDYRNMLAKGLGQLQGTPGVPQPSAELGGGPGMPAQSPDPMGAMATFGSHPMGQQFVPMAMQELQRQKLIQALRGPQAGQQPQQAGNPMQGGPGASVMAPGGAQPQQGVGMGGPAGGIPMEAWLQTDPTGKSYLQHLASQGETSGRVSYDQSGKAFTVGKNGQPIYLQGISARDKPEAVNLGGSTQFVNPYQANGQQLQHTPTIGNRLEAANVYHNTGQNPLGMNFGGGPQPAPRPTPQPSPAPAAIPAPQPTRPPQANPNARLTPKQQQELEANRPHAESAATTVLQANERLMNIANELKDHPGLSGITGKINQYSAGDVFPETRAARGLQSTMVKQVGIQTLQAMRDASKTGGAVGNVTEKEWPILQQSIAALDDAQSTGDYQKALENLVAQIQSSSERVRQAYEQTYGGLNYKSVPHTPQGRGPTPGSPINWNDLPRGR